MKIVVIILFPILAPFSSCVLQSEHDKVIAEKNVITQERDKLKSELEEIKFGAPNLFADGVKFYDSKDFKMAREKFQTLMERHADMPQSIDAKKYLLTIDEEELWNNAKTSDDISYVESYLAKYSRGKYIVYAISRHSELKAFNMQKAYDDASNKNTSIAWKKFLEDYPNHRESAAIRKKIIRLEVEEISGDRETGAIPSFDQYNTGYTSNSSVAITNNTGCELTIRYSGPDAEMIIIPAGSMKTIYLPSGNYQIAASACGANYAGTESLHGEYGSAFYIVTTKY
jgi:hypothetical protein